MGTLERIIDNKDTGAVNRIVFREIQPNSVSSGICYVRDGEHRFTKADKPFIKLYLQDTTGFIIPGYIFDVDRYSSGIDLTNVIRSVVKINYKENFLANYGLTVIIDKIDVVVNPDSGLLDIYVGTIQEAKSKYDLLLEGISNKLGLKVAIPYDICSTSYIDYSQGKIGGLSIHYWDMFRMLEVYADKFDDNECAQLWGTFLLYIFTHSNFLKAQSKGKNDITLVSALTSHLQKYSSQLEVSEGIIELVHIFFGYEPKDLFVRLVKNVSEQIVRANKEFNLYETLPITREGNAGYGPVRKYPDKNQ